MLMIIHSIKFVPLAWFLNIRMSIHFICLILQSIYTSSIKQHNYHNKLATIAFSTATIEHVVAIEHSIFTNSLQHPK